MRDRQVINNFIKEVGLKKSFNLICDREGIYIINKKTNTIAIPLDENYYLKRIDNEVTLVEDDSFQEWNDIFHRNYLSIYLHSLYSGNSFKITVAYSSSKLSSNYFHYLLILQN